MNSKSRQRVKVVHPRGVVILSDGRIGLPFLSRRGGKAGIRMLTGDGRGSFTATDRMISIRLLDGGLEEIAYCRGMASASLKEGNSLVYLRDDGDVTSLVWAGQTGEAEWVVRGETMTINRPGVIVAGGTVRAPVLVFGDYCLRFAIWSGRDNWEVSSRLTAAPRRNRFDFKALRPLWAQYDRQGIFVLYDSSYRIDEERVLLQVGCLLLDRDEPIKMIWRTETPLFAQVYRQKGELQPVGAVAKGDKLHIYWEFLGEDLVMVTIPNPLYQRRRRVMPVTGLIARYHANPILLPGLKNKWERGGTFNPAALLIDGVVHLIYRAVGSDGVSVFGHAVSADGKKIDERSKEPVYWPRAAFEGRRGKPAPYWGNWQSGWGWGGCEDPKLTQIGDRVYLTYVAHSGCSEPRCAISSIRVEDFTSQNWNWEEPKLMSEPGVVTKSACLMSEKINGKYVMFHRVFPNIFIDYREELDYGEGAWLKTQDVIPIRPRMWDSRKLSVGAPPLKTNQGWLVIYHAVDDKDDKKYKAGAMVLAREDPSRVLWRTRYPMLSPDMWYENDWKPGIAYPSGAVIKDDELLVYYGGGDKAVCLARAGLGEFMDRLMVAENAVGV